MAYSRSNILSNKEILAKYNHHKLHEFKQDTQQRELIIHPPSIVPGVLAKSHPWHYRKKSFQVGKSSVTLISKNNKFDSFLWKTTAEKIRQATRWGFVSTHSVTAKTISTLGQYRLIQLERAKEGYQSNRSSTKNLLTELYQDRFEALQKLEYLVNRNLPAPIINNVFDKYFEAMGQLLQSLDVRFANSPLSNLDSLAIQRLRLSMQKECQRVEEFKNHANANTSQSTGIQSIFTFIKMQLIRNLRELQGINQNITYSNALSFAATRGDLNSIIEDAMKGIEDFEALPNDAVRSCHHGLFGKLDEEVIYDSSAHHLEPTQYQQALTAITFIEKANDIAKLNLKTINATKWRFNGTVLTTLKRSLAWVFNVTNKVISGFLDLVTLGFIPPLRFMATYQIVIKNPHSIQLKHQELLDYAVIPPVALGLRVRNFIINGFKNTFSDLVYGVRDAYKQVTVHLLDDIYNDYYDGLDTQPEFGTVLNNIQEESKKISAQEKADLSHILKKVYPNQPISEVIDEKLYLKKFATPTFIPQSGEWNDLVSAAARGGDQFMSFFLHNVHAKHPFTGLIFTLTYLAGAGAILAPHFVNFLGQGFITYSKGLGYGMAKSAKGAAVASGCTQAQMTSAIYELLLHGPKSWAGISATRFENDPATSLVYAASAVGLGFLIAFKLNIPWLSETLREDLGTFPISALGFAGAKVGILIHELIEEREPVMDRGIAASKLKEFLIKHYQDKHPTEAAESVKIKVEGMVNHLFEKENLQELTQALSILKSKQQQHHLKRSVTISHLDFNRYQVIHLIRNHSDHLSQLSEKNKHQLMQKLKSLFNVGDARSLKSVLYPEEVNSIFRTTLTIVVGYIAYPLRLLAASMSSLILWNRQPLVSAGSDFAFKIAKDLTRVGRGLSKIVKTIINFPRRHLKVIADVLLNSILARIQGFFFNSHRIGNANYAASGSIDAVIVEQGRQFLSTPIDFAVRNVTAAHPENSCARILKAISFIPTPATPSSLEEKSHESSSIKVSRSLGKVEAIENLSDELKPKFTR